MLPDHTNIIPRRRCQYLIWMDTLDTFFISITGTSFDLKVLIGVLFLGTKTAKPLLKTMNACGAGLCKKTGFSILIGPVSE